ncbi:MAG TPA: biosynthetic peptidoglycan transglycosylase, partial [Methyloceanibacter sp.]|nr:biosynthetic peptidoglycan transglycosylase [Methyloceanibacter sp.]
MTSDKSTSGPETIDTAPPTPSKLRAWARTGALWFGGLLSAGANGLLVTGLLVATPFALVTPLGNYSLSQLQPPAERTLVLHGIDGQPFARRGGCVAESVQLSEVPDHFVDALLAMEDRRFRYHLGVDPIGTARALFRNLDAGTFVQGGSTLTQQLVKNAFLSSDRTLERKQKEALLSLWLEWRLSKTEILEHYMSRVYFGEGCFGLRAAA